MRKRKVSRPHHDFIAIINRVAETCRLYDIEYFIEIGSDDVDCLVGGAYKVKIKGLQDGVKITKTFIIKWHANSMSSVSFRELYRREIAFYKFIVPALLEVQRKFNIIEGLRMKFVNCVYGANDFEKESIALTAPQGFFLNDRFNKITFDHGVLIIKNLAKLHALSFTLAKLSPGEFDKIKKICEKDVQYGELDRIPKSLKYYFDTSIAVVRDTAAQEKLKNISCNVLQLLHKCSSPISDYNVICHSDCWNNNIIFKYQGKRPVDALLIDYQLIRYATPVTDLSYFFYMSTDRDFLENYYDRLIHVYYGTLTAVLRQCHLNIQDIYPESVFQNHLKDYSVYGLIEALISMKIITAASEEALLMTEMRYLHPEELCHYELTNQNLYVERINGVVDHFFNRNYSLNNVLKE